jgi:hypothetical protein
MNRALSFPDPSPNELVRPPMVYVKIDPKWEYKQLVRNLASEPALTEDELNALGAGGWELAGVFSDSPAAYYYFKRSIS